MLLSTLDKNNLKLDLHRFDVLTNKQSTVEHVYC